MTIKFSCSCGKLYVVSESKAGKTGKCSCCTGQLTVPLSSEEIASALPPRRKRHRQPRPKLNASFSDERLASETQTEMHPVVVTLIALVLLFNGWEACSQLIFLPIIAHFLTADTELPSTEPQEEQPVKIVAFVLAFLAVFGLGHLSLAGSMVGLLLWRGYAMYFALAASAFLFIAQFVFWNFEPIIQFDLAATISIWILLRYPNPGVWNRLMTTS